MRWNFPSPASGRNPRARPVADGFLSGSDLLLPIIKVTSDLISRGTEEVRAQLRHQVEPAIGGEERWRGVEQPLSGLAARVNQAVPPIGLVLLGPATGRRPIPPRALVKQPAKLLAAQCEKLGLHLGDDAASELGLCAVIRR
jgi:hypothetical protein